jgi:DNA-binding transcriptional LysR family regulator
MDKLSAMKTFVRVVEAGSFSAVAAESNTTQSAVSKQVAALEKALGATLLTRTTRSLAMTEEGERYFEHVRRLVAEVAEVEAALRKGESQLSGWIRVAASVGFGRLKLMPLVRTFMDKHPEIKVDLRLHDGFIDLVEQGIDLSVRIGDLADSSLIARRAGISQRMLLASRDYVRGLPPTLKAPTHPDDLVGHNCLVYTGLSDRNLWTFRAGPGAKEALGTSRSIGVEGRLQTNSSEVIREAVISGMGIGYSPTWLFDEEIKSGTVVRLMPDWESPKSLIQLVSPAQRKNSVKVKAFAEHVAHALSRAASTLSSV